jgi:hypothetical protein
VIFQNRDCEYRPRELVLIVTIPNSGRGAR